MFEHIKLKGDFTLNSGKKSNCFYDFDLLIPDDVNYYVNLLLNKVEKCLPVFHFVVCAAIGGIVPAYEVAKCVNIPLIIIDKHNNIRGKLPNKNDSYIIVDDVISSYGTIDRLKAVLLKYNCVGEVAYIFRGENKRPTTIVLEDKEVEI